MFRYAICNETFQGCPFLETVKIARAAGYTGVEIAPFTLSPDPASLGADQRREYRTLIEAEGLRLVGLHWLLAAPPGLHLTTPDRAVRERSWLYFRRLIDLCADLGDGGVLVLGSPKQRSTAEGLSPAQARRHLAEGLAETAPQAAACGATILIEALSPDQSDVVTTITEAAATRVGSRSKCLTTRRAARGLHETPCVTWSRRLRE